MRLLFLILLTVSLLIPRGGLGHEAHPVETAPPPAGAAVGIVEIYRSEIEPIFRQKCFDCHSTKTRYPWYYKLPGARQLIDYDIREAREHIDMTDGFPFKGHHSLEDQLKSLERVVRKNEMPLWRYRLLHPGAGLTDDERQAILEWVREWLRNPRGKTDAPPVTRERIRCLLS